MKVTTCESASEELRRFLFLGRKLNFLHVWRYEHAREPADTVFHDALLLDGLDHLVALPQSDLCPLTLKEVWRMFARTFRFYFKKIWMNTLQIQNLLEPDGTMSQNGNRPPSSSSSFIREDRGRNSHATPGTRQVHWVEKLRACSVGTEWNNVPRERDSPLPVMSNGMPKERKLKEAPRANECARRVVKMNSRWKSKRAQPLPNSDRLCST